MNKTLSVNIGGIVFHIEEHAYEKLNRYLDAIKGYFTTSDGRDEIIQDIEGRIAEMFQERISNSKQVIIESDVEHVINVMGRPEQLAGKDEEEEQQQASGKQSYQERKAYRRLYRDPDDRVIGGVCSGFSHYLGVDPTYIRLAFAIAFFVFGSGFLLYLILMIIMPKAITTAEKLEMKGEQVNINNISKTVKDEFSSIKSNFEQSGAQSGIARFFDGLGQILGGIFKILGKIIAIFFVIIGIFFLIAMGALFVGLAGISGFSVPFFVTEVFMEPWQQTFMLITVFLVIGIPLIMIIYKSVKILFTIKTEYKVLNWTALALWICGVIMAFALGSIVGREFKDSETYRQEIPIVTPASDTLRLELKSSGQMHDEWYYSSADRRHNDQWILRSGVDTMQVDDVNLDVIKGEGPGFELIQINKSRGANRRDALDNARRVLYSVEQQDSLLVFDESYLIPKGVKYRGQHVQLLLKVPVGKSVYLSPSVEDLIYDIKNVTNTFDGDMVGHTWTMTPAGLECIGCELEYVSKNNKSDDIRININGKGIKVQGVDSGSNANINVDSKDVDIKINDNGIQIDAPKK